MLVPMYQNLPPIQADTYSLVLASAGIFHQVRREASGWEIRVDEADETAARRHIQEYESENRKAPPIASSSAVRIQFADSVIVALLLMVIHMAVSGNQRTFIELYGASAGGIMDGDLYRTATALLLHSDAVHLVGNMAAIILFGAVVGSVNGYGLGWLMILLSGMLGNGLNAYLQHAQHLSIGASTAVFGAVGMLAAYQFWRKIQPSGQRIKAWLPLAGGLALLAMLGSGAGRVDVMAHLFGFTCGIGIQLLFQTIMWVERLPGLPRRHQAACLTFAVFILGISCLWPTLR